MTARDIGDVEERDVRYYGDTSDRGTVRYAIRAASACHIHSAKAAMLMLPYAMPLILR